MDGDSAGCPIPSTQLLSLYAHGCMFQTFFLKNQNATQTALARPCARELHNSCITMSYVLHARAFVRNHQSRCWGTVHPYVPTQVCMHSHMCTPPGSRVSGLGPMRIHVVSALHASWANPCLIGLVPTLVVHAPWAIHYTERCRIGSIHYAWCELGP